MFIAGDIVCRKKGNDNDYAYRILSFNDVDNSYMLVVVPNGNYHFKLSADYIDNEYSIKEHEGCYKPDYIKKATDNYCSHNNKRKTWLISSQFWYCPECKKDLGNVIN